MPKELRAAVTDGMVHFSWENQLLYWFFFAAPVTGTSPTTVSKNEVEAKAFIAR